MSDTNFAPEQEETKYVLTPEQAHNVWGAFAAHLPPHRSRGVGWVRTTYFDTAARVFCRSLDTPVTRRLRVREYGPARGPQGPAAKTCFLELKQSSNGQRSKLRLPQRVDEIYDTLATLASTPLVPVLATQYRRAALCNEDESIRVTLDDEISFQLPRKIGSAFRAPAASELLARGPAFIIEVKLRGAAPRWLEEVTPFLPDAQAFSKFETGLGLAAHNPAVPDLARSPQREAQP